MAHHAEPEAVDLLLETERLDLLPPLVDAASCASRDQNCRAAARRGSNGGPTEPIFFFVFSGFF